MGDRTTCTLYLPIPPNQELLELLVENLGEPDETDNDRWFTWHEVNYASLPDEVQVHLHAERIPYVWSWAAGGGYGSGEEIFDGEVLEDFVTSYDGDLVIHLSQVDDAEFIARAKRFARLRTTIIKGVL